MTNFVVAIDGPAGSGKSSVSRRVASDLGFGYLDTGAAYRALTWWVYERANQPVESLGSGEFAADFDYRISTDPNDFWVKVAETDLTEKIRESNIALKVSDVAKQPAVREFMRELTRREVAKCSLPGIVVEGRDITSVVLPDAQIRLLLTADESVRLGRRSAEMPAAKQLGHEVSKRDLADSRVVDFMNPAAGVTLVDSTDLDFDQTVAAVKAFIAKQTN